MITFFPHALSTLQKVIAGKGRTISRANYGFLNASKKQTKLTNSQFEELGRLSIAFEI